MANDIKSALHDATPSWNGFNYQGKVGLYVSLKNINLKILELGFNSQELDGYIDETFIEYEWIEDFAIKNDRGYISLHQVKHKAGNNFSDHISAITTILNRKECRLSETDFNKYIELDIDYTGCNTPEEIATKKIISINQKMDALTASGYLNEQRKLADGWKTITTAIEGVNTEALLCMLNDFEMFTDMTFKDSTVYFHTSENVTAPTKDIDKYIGIPEHHRPVLNGLRTLSSFNILLPFDTQKPYELSFDDDRLNNAIKEEVVILLKLYHPHEEYSESDIELYIASMIRCIDRHISMRHQKIRKCENIGFGFAEQRHGLCFRDLIVKLNKNMKDLDDNYWNSLCAKVFEQVFFEKINTLQRMIAADRNTEENKIKTARLEKHREVLLDNNSYLSLLKSLSPHISNQKSQQEYYTEILNHDNIKFVFLNFIEKLNTINKELLIDANNEHIYHPSLINISSAEEEYDIILEQHRYTISQKNDVQHLLNATHLVIKAGQNQNIDVSVRLATIIEQNSNNGVGEHILDRNLKFESIDNAVEIMNQ